MFAMSSTEEKKTNYQVHREFTDTIMVLHTTIIFNFSDADLFIGIMTRQLLGKG